MATTLQFRRGNSAAAAAVTGANGEIYINTQTKTVHVHDGVTAGGSALANASSVTAAIVTASSDANTKAATAYSNAISFAANASNLTTGTVPSARLGSGTANSTTVLYGNGVWGAVSGGGSDLGAVSEDIIPSFDSVYDIGSANTRFYDVFVGNNVDINGATLSGTAAVGNSQPILSTSSDVVMTGALLVDELLLSTNMITPDATSARQYMGDKGVVTINGDLDVDGDWLGVPAVETILGAPGAQPGGVAYPDFFGSGFNDYGSVAVIQPDGKILLGGFFTQFNGTAAGRIVRLNVDGSIDSTFSTGTGFDNTVYNIALQSDGKILVSGAFDTYNSTSKPQLARLNADGSLDNTFTSPGFFNGALSALAIQPSGKILVGGSFSTLNGSATGRIVRLNTDGSKDNTFSSGSGFNDFVQDIAFQSDGKIIVGGNFTTYDGASAVDIIRLNTDGSRDSTFVNSGTSGGGNYISSINVQPDDSLIVVGAFDTMDGSPAGSVAKLNPNGSIDNSFDVSPGARNGDYVSSVFDSITQPDGKIIISGNFITYDGMNIRSLIRVDPNDGSIDTEFDAGSGFTNGARSLALTETGQIVATGIFDTYQDIPQNNVTLIETVSTVGQDSITPPTGGEEGFIRYNKDITAFQGYNGTSWELLERVTTPPTTLARSAAGPVDIDFTGASLGTFSSLEGQAALFTGTNYLPGSSVTVRVVSGDGGAVGLSFPAGWIFVGTKPTELAASKTGILTITSFGTTEAECVAAWAAEA